MAAERRVALKILGTIGTSCLFPFEADELYGQHAHAESGEPVVKEPPAPRTLNDREMALVARVSDLIIPATGTPGAVAAGVPAYINRAAGTNPKMRKVLGEGLKWLHRSKFLDKDEPAQVEFLRQLCHAAETEKRTGKHETFWRTIKSLTADGYYTSRVGLRDELGYAGNTVLESFPECSIREH